MAWEMLKDKKQSSKHHTVEAQLCVNTPKRAGRAPREAETGSLKAGAQTGPSDSHSNPDSGWPARRRLSMLPSTFLTFPHHLKCIKETTNC